MSHPNWLLPARLDARDTLTSQSAVAQDNRQQRHAQAASPVEETTPSTPTPLAG